MGYTVHIHTTHTHIHTHMYTHMHKHAQRHTHIHTHTHSHTPTLKNSCPQKHNFPYPRGQQDTNTGNAMKEEHTPHRALLRCYSPCTAGRTALTRVHTAFIHLDI